MRIHLLSDLHIEFDRFIPPAVDADVVILAGDIGVGTLGVKWAAEAFSCPVLYVPGNHEFYGGQLTRTLDKMRDARADHVQVLDRDVAVIGGVRFLGATGWTDYKSTGDRVAAMERAFLQMNDFRAIRTHDFRRTRPADFALEARATREWLLAELDKHFDGPTVVVTHHAPLLRCLDVSPHGRSHLDAAYANDWQDIFKLGVVDLWMHGHSHAAIDFKVGKARIVCNPRGYPGEETNWKPDLILRVGHQ